MVKYFVKRYITVFLEANEMSSAIGSMNNVKIFVLYLMKNINYPLDFVTINDIVMQTDYVMYLDFAVAFNEMLDSGLIEKTVEEASQLCEGGEFDSLELLYSFFSRGKQDEKLIDAVQSIYKHIRLYPDPEARLLEICGGVDISKYITSDIMFIIVN